MKLMRFHNIPWYKILLSFNYDVFLLTFLFAFGAFKS